MPNKFIPVNELLQQTTLKQFVDHYQFPSEIKQTGQEERLQSPFPCDKCRGNGLVVAVNWPAGVFISHCYHCDVRGRVTTLLYGMKHGAKPSNNPLKGEEFLEIANDIAIVSGYLKEEHQPTSLQTSTSQPSHSPTHDKSVETKINLPLSRHPDPKIQALEHLDDQFAEYESELCARAQAYLGIRPYLTPEVMKQWGVGFLPSSSKSMLRGRMVYALRNEKSQLLGWVGRDLAFEEKLRKWENSDRKQPAPIKTKFPPGFARGSFLYGAEVERLNHPGVREQLMHTGLVLTEGMNDCIAAGENGITTISLCSNRIAEGQIEKVIRWSREIAGGKITLLLDNDPEGFEGAKQIIEKLGQELFVRNAWTRECYCGEFRGKQPEQLSKIELERVLRVPENWIYE